MGGWLGWDGVEPGVCICADRWVETGQVEVLSDKCRQTERWVNKHVGGCLVSGLVLDTGGWIDR